MKEVRDIKRNEVNGQISSTDHIVSIDNSMNSIFYNYKGHKTNMDVLINTYTCDECYSNFFAPF